MSVKAQALAIIRERYADFGPTLAAEKLRELYGIMISPEKVEGVRPLCARRPLG